MSAQISSMSSTTASRTGIAARLPSVPLDDGALLDVLTDAAAAIRAALDGYLDCVVDAHGPWDYLGGLLVCTEAGAVVADLAGRDLVTRGHADRRTPVAAATPELLEELRRAGGPLSDENSGSSR